MKIPFLTILFLVNLHYGHSNVKDSQSDTISEIIESMLLEIKKTKNNYQDLYDQIDLEIQHLNGELFKACHSNTKLDLLINKLNLHEKLERLYQKEESDISKIRYLKGLQIIKILYEKTLSLDHHFATVSTLNDINNISNPNHYPEFINIKESLSTEKKIGFDLTPILGENIYTSVIYSLVSLFSNTNSSKKEKDQDIKQIECILDFTLNIHNNLNIIYFETAYLQKSNDNMIKSIEKLFVDFTKPIGYSTNLIDCRSNDDWDSIKDNLNHYLDKINTILLEYETQHKAKYMLIELEFTIDRLLQFISQYNNFIDQCGKYYEKFAIMLDSYENEQVCAFRIPVEFLKMKENIFISIKKFNTAYKPVEINGSKLKEVLYGIHEYD